MKRLRRFNESKTEIDYDYIYECFGELIDEGKVEIELIRGGDSQLSSDSYPYVTIRVRKRSKEDTRITSQSKTLDSSPIYNMIENHNYNNTLFQELMVALKRLENSYPKYKIQFHEYDTSIFIEIFKNKGLIEIEYPF